MQRVMICGSRDATPEMLAYVRQQVAVAQQNQWRILCGDAMGVDQAVVRACSEMNVVCICAGLDKKPRNGGATNPRSIYINVKKEHKIAAYRERDEWLVNAASAVIAVWNGSSPGTGHVVNYTRQFRYSKQLVVAKFEPVLEPSF